MNIYALFPLIATAAYIPLLVITLSNRPWQKQHKLFMLYIASAAAWSLADFLCRSTYFQNHALGMGRIVIIGFATAMVHFHVFTSSFFAPGQNRWLLLAYGGLVLTIVLVVLGYVPESMTVSGERVLPVYGNLTFVMMVPLIALLGRNIYVFTKRLKTLDNPVLYSQIVSLLFALIVIAVFSAASLLPWGREFPLSHFGNIINAFVLAYATVGHQLVDIRYVMRRALAWLTLGVAGASIYVIFILLFHYVLGYDIDFTLVIIGLAAAVLAGTVVYMLRGFSQHNIDRMFYSKTYDYRQQLTDFIGRIHNVFSLRELSTELLPLLVKATKCKRGALFFPESGSGDFVAHLAEPAEPDNPLSSLRIRHDNPIIRFMERKHRLLTVQSLDIMPEFYSLWEQEREAIVAAEIELFIPVVSRGKLVSILILSRKQTGRNLLEDISLLEDVTSRVAVSLERGYLHEEVRQRQEELSLISPLAAIMTSSLDINEISENFIKELKKVIDTDSVAINVVEGETFHILALSADIPLEWQPGERVPLKDTGVQWAIENKKPLLEPDLSQESRFWTDERHLREGLHSMLHLPLVLNDKAIGTLTLGSRQPNAFSQGQVQLLAQLAAQIATPIENARLYAEAEQLARLDQLTGLWNRRHLEERIQIEIGRHSRYGGAFSLVILDLDFFKAFNDSYGHLAGDKLLRQLGALMRSLIRGTDEAFRYGGDEFAILLSQTAVQDAFDVAERVRERVVSEIKVGDTPVTASFGLASWPADGIRINEIMASADMALYYAKQNGGNQTRAISELVPTATKHMPRMDQEQERGAYNLICALAAAVDAKDHYAYKHSQNVREYAIALAKSLELPPEDISRLSTSALLHDIGKIGIADEILNKAAPLSPEEWEVMKSHPRLGADIVSHVSQLAPCLAGILYHHERYDGTGYPAGLKGDAIPLDARILGVVDAFEAMTSARPYRPAFTQEEALAELRRGAGKQFDPELVKSFIALRNAPATPASEDTSGEPTLK